MNFNSIFTIDKINKYIVPFIFIIYLLIGLSAYNDYGVGTDNNTHRILSTYNLLTAANHIAVLVNTDSAVQKTKKELDKFNVKYQGHPCGESFGVPLVMLEGAFFGIKKSPTKEIYEFRHLVTFLFFYIGVFFFYFLIKNISGKRPVAILTTIMLMLSPRIFSDSFHNQQDTVFLSACIMAIFFYVKYLKDKTYKNAILLGFFAAFATGIRFLGIQFIMMALFFVVLGFIKERKINRVVLASSVTAVLVYIVFTIFHYPVSWSSPLLFFTKLVTTVSEFPHEATQLFMGEWIEAQSIPWFYLPVWMFITIPVLYIVIFFHGVYLLVRRFIDLNELKELSIDYQILLSAAIMFFIPILGIMVKGSPLYNGWRHLYFLYLPFMIIISYSLKIILSRLENKKATVFIYGFSGLYLFSIAIWMTINHPYQNSFFNAIPCNIESSYEKDYWGISMLDGMKYIHQRRLLLKEAGVLQNSHGICSTKSLKNVLKLCRMIHLLQKILITFYIMVILMEQKITQRLIN